MALIPKFFPDCVVAIGANDPSEEKKVAWVASGFLYGQSVESPKPGHRTYLITNRHVFENMSTVFLRFNPRDQGSPLNLALELLNEEHEPIWFAHPNPKIDVAALPIDFDLLEKQGLQVAFFASEAAVANIDKMNAEGITEGDFVYVLGFPMGLVGESRNTVIVRGGVISRIRDALSRANTEFLVDAPVFPGNSGGPVVSKPEAIAIQGTKGQLASYLIGIVKSYVPYRDVAISQQTRRPRVIFEENSGITVAHPIDFVQETVSVHLKKLVEQPKTTAEPVTTVSAKAAA